MADGAFSGSFMLHLDEDDGRTLVGFAPGPAGMAVLDLGRGMTLAVDFADPTTLVSCRADGWLRDDVLEVLIGAGAARQVSQVQQTDRPVRISDGSEVAREPNRNRSDPSGGPMAMAFGTCAVLSSIADDEQRHELVRAVAALELADSIAALPLPVDVVEGVADRSRRRAIELLADGIEAFETLADNDPRSATRVRLLLNSAMKHDGADDLRLRPISSDFDRTIRRGQASTRVAAAPARAMPMATPDAAAPMLERSMVDLRPKGLLVVHRLPAEEYAAAWVRVLRQPQLTLVAVAPLLRSGSRLRAELLVPPDLTVDQLVVELTNDPLPAAPTLSRIRQAIDLGRRAASLEALRSPHASEAWHACAAAWTALDDPRRAQLARRHSTGPRRSRRAAIAEHVARSVGAA